jgi:hypothetical protein
LVRAPGSAHQSRVVARARRVHSFGGRTQWPATGTRVAKLSALNRQLSAVSLAAFDGSAGVRAKVRDRCAADQAKPRGRRATRHRLLASAKNHYKSGGLRDLSGDVAGDTATSPRHGAAKVFSFRFSVFSRTRDYREDAKSAKSRRDVPLSTFRFPLSALGMSVAYASGSCADFRFPSFDFPSAAFRFPLSALRMSVAYASGSCADFRFSLLALDSSARPWSLAALPLRLKTEH